jgi:hypothetical protein
MTESNGFSFDARLADNDMIDAALKRAARDAALTHARLGRPLPDWKDDKVVWLSPAEVFARYGLDEHGNPPATSPPPSA